jgi:MFS family permease
MSHAIPRRVYLLALAQALSASGTVVIVVFGGILGARLAPDPALATLPVSMSIMGLALTTLPGALLMQRIGRRRAFMLSAACAGLASLLVAWSIWRSNYLLFCCSIVFMGANLAFVQQYRFAAIEYVVPERASVAVSTVMTGMLAAALGAPPLALLARHALADTEYVGSFVVVALLYAAAVIVLSFLPDSTARPAASAAPARPLREIARQPAFLVAVLAGIAAYGVMSFIMTATPLSMHVIDHHGVDDTMWVVQSHLLGMYLPALASGWLIARVGVKPMMLLGTLLMGACIVVSVTGAHQLMHYWWGLVLLGAGWNLLFVAGTTLLTSSYRASERFKAQGVNELAVFGSQSLASLLAGPAIHYLGWTRLNLASVPLLVAMLFALVVLYRRAPPPEPASAMVTPR